MALSSIERVFIRAAEADAGTALIYADWLEEQGREEEAASLRDLSGEAGYSDGDGYGYGYGDGYGNGYGYGDG